MRYIATRSWRKVKGGSPKTIGLKLQAIVWFYRWGQQQAEPWQPEIRLLEPIALNEEQVSSLSNFLRLQRHQCQPELVALEVGAKGKRVILKPSSVTTYLGCVRDFVKWALTTQATPRLSPEAVEPMEKLFNTEIESLGQVRPAPGAYIDTNEQLEMLTVCHPASEKNPFNRQVRFRNYAIIYVLLSTGLRRGELLKLRVEDLNLDLENPSLSVVLQSEEDESERFDTRVNKPRQKTLGRRIPLSLDVRAALVAYLRRERDGYSESPFLFLSSRGGRPLAETAVNNLFFQINRRFPGEFSALRPHLMRHTFSGNFIRHNETANLKGDLLTQVQNYISGWTAGSQQGAKYGTPANSLIAEKYIREMHSGIVSKRPL